MRLRPLLSNSELIAKVNRNLKADFIVFSHINDRWRMFATLAAALRKSNRLLYRPPLKKSPLLK